MIPRGPPGTPTQLPSVVALLTYPGLVSLLPVSLSHALTPASSQAPRATSTALSWALLLEKLKCRGGCDLKRHQEVK